MKYTLRASGWTHSTKLYRNIKICIHRILEQLVGTMNYFVCISVTEIYLETLSMSVLRRVIGATIHQNLELCAVLPLAKTSFTLKYQNI